MLTELCIRDLALIERAELSFGPGLNVITGETGAGKSLLIGALELLLGRSPRANLLRRGAERAGVEGRWWFAPGRAPTALVEWLAGELPDALEEAESDEGLELVLSRTLGSDGRTRARVNHRPVTRRALRELAGMLVEVHGQNDHQRLLERGEQTRLVDAYGGLEGLVADYRAARVHWVAATEKARTFEADEAERSARIDLLRFQVGELEALGPVAGEDEALRGEREVLRNAEALEAELGTVVEEIGERDGCLLGAVQGAEAAVARWEATIERLGEPAADLRGAAAHLEQALFGLRTFLDDAEGDAGRLEEVEERLAEAERLGRKHRAGADELAAVLERQRSELAELVERETDREGLAREAAQARERLEAAAAALSNARRALVPALVEAVGAGLAELGLERARFDLRVEPRTAEEAGEDSDPTALARRFALDGCDELEFLLAANPGEGCAPLAGVASGGEAARIMLALRGALASCHTIPSLVFDEVDAGVGGRLAPRVGEHLRALGEEYQILCVTHLPAVAAAADRHLRVAKRESEGRTATFVATLEGEERVAEVADLISGGADESTALAEARRLLSARGGATAPSAR
ncbi:MAG: DNA repair protein RecN [Planctomycetota bacterium]|jgi:DNA repair protein RecN (Recombination protein N)|nr:DNA repair protein RecN [Planctomycetota bacterium]MDP6761957.1 DNA repair protein RecN [Planctomycetota bacterium]MDP6990727.1 DNA repair protein RecN [Planctomycetota bacterium]